MERKKGFYEKFLKRPQDLACSILAIIILSPVLLTIAILVRINLGSPVIFRQKRPGKNEKIFTLYKFRTMTDAKNEQGELLPDDIRLTTFGKWLRRSSLDELPELLNILKGDMAVVGPRPLLPQYLLLYNDEQKKRHLVRPGFTGLAQISGRNAISWEQKFSKDIEYIDHISFWKDWAIILKTVMVVLQRKGISSESSETMELFRGNQIPDNEEVKLELKQELKQDAKNLLIIGAGGFGREVAYLVERINFIKQEWNLLGFLDDQKEKGTLAGKYKVLGSCSDIGDYPDCFVICAVGNAMKRKEIIETLNAEKDIKFATLVDPSVIYSDTTKIGEGSIICAGNIITVDNCIGRHTIINLSCTIGHDANLHDFVTVYPGVNVSGGVTIEMCVELGTGSKIIQGLQICKNVIVGAGAVVNRSINEKGTYVGVPAKRICVKK